MKTRLVQIGNSRGVRIPKPLIEQLGLEAEVELRAVDNALVIMPAHRPRADWAQAAELLHQRGEDGLLDEPASNRFDDAEWEWQ